MKLIPTILTLLLCAPAALAQEGAAAEPSIDDAGKRMQAELEEATKELAALRQRDTRLLLSTTSNTTLAAEGSWNSGQNRSGGGHDHRSLWAAVWRADCLR